jgi:hypothetical protein
MYSGSGVFKEFSKEDLNCENLPYQYNIEVEG